MDDVPVIDLPHASFERVVARVAESPTPSLWVVQTRQRRRGCLDDVVWQFGTYGFGAGFSKCQMPLRSSVGPDYLLFAPQERALPEPCGVDLQERGEGVPEFSGHLDAFWGYLTAGCFASLGDCAVAGHTGFCQ